MGQGWQIATILMSGLPQASPTFVSVSPEKSHLDRPTDHTESCKMASAVRTDAVDLWVGLGDALSLQICVICFDTLVWYFCKWFNCSDFLY